MELIIHHDESAELTTLCKVTRSLMPSKNNTSIRFVHECKGVKESDLVMCVVCGYGWSGYFGDCYVKVRGALIPTLWKYYVQNGCKCYHFWLGRRMVNIPSGEHVSEMVDDFRLFGFYERPPAERDDKGIG